MSVKVIVAVGEYESLCALQGVGIRLRRGTYRSEILLERKQLCRQIVHLAYSVLFPKRPPLTPNVANLVPSTYALLFSLSI